MKFLLPGVFEDIPANSSMEFDAVLPFEIYKDLVGKESLHWGNFGSSTFIVLKEGNDVTTVNKR